LTGLLSATKHSHELLEYPDIINLLEIKIINVGNMPPAIFVPQFYYMLKQLVNYI